MSNVIPLPRPGPAHASSHDPIVSGAWESWLDALDVRPATRRTYRIALQSIQDFHRAADLDNVRASTLMAWRDSSLNEGMSANSVATYTAAARAYCRVAYPAESDPSARIRTRRVNEHQRLALSAEQARAMLDAMPELTALDHRDRAIIAVTLTCGLRAIEVTRARATDYRIEDGQRIIRIQGKGRDAPDALAVIVPPVLEIMGYWMRHRPDSPWLFCSTGPRNEGGQLTTRTVSRIGRAALDAVHLTDRAYSFHSLRHTAACLLLEAGGDYAAAQSLLRHASIDTTRIYTGSIARRERLHNPPESLVARAIFDREQNPGVTLGEKIAQITTESTQAGFFRLAQYLTIAQDILTQESGLK